MAEDPSFAPAASADELLIERRGRVLRLTLNRPARHNPLSRALLARLRDALDATRGDADLGCVLLRGAGERYFAAGGDLRDLAAVRSEADTRTMVAAASAALDAVREFPLPVLAVLNGDALGGGAELALACDLRLMRAGARIGYIHGRLAITPAWGGGADLIDLVGRARALRMMAGAELVEAATALAWGMADAVLAADALDAGVDAFIAPLLAQPGAVLRAAKAQALAARRGLPHAARRALEQQHIVETWIGAAHWAAVDRILGRGG